MSKYDETHPLSITWNITKKCLFRCSFCATKNSRIELTASQKTAVLESILSTKNYQIKELDFAGGDPLVDESSRNLILLAQETIGPDAVTVTTTYRGIDCVPEQQLSAFLNSCELSVDVPLQIDQRKEPTYSSGNLHAIKQYASCFARLTINIVITDSAISEEGIRRICDYLNRLKATDIRIVVIRLMPVGGLGKEQLPGEYDPSAVVNLLRKNLQPSIPVHLHCVLRGAIDQDLDHCGMASHKIGIDCAGNVFACAWAGDDYVDLPPNQNPFYLGNLLEHPLDEIMTSEKASSLARVAENAGMLCPLLDGLV